MHPFHLATLVMFISHVLLIPIGYYRLFRFTERNNSKVAGSISVKARIKRKKQNLVTAKFNFLNWLLEAVSLVVVLAGYGKVTTVVYIFLTSCGPPCIYFLGVEENRKAVRQSLASRIKNVKQKQRKKREEEEVEQRDQEAEQMEMEEKGHRVISAKKQGKERVKDKTNEKTAEVDANINEDSDMSSHDENAVQQLMVGRPSSENNITVQHVAAENKEASSYGQDEEVQIREAAKRSLKTVAQYRSWLQAMAVTEKEPHAVIVERNEFSSSRSSSPITAEYCKIETNKN